MSGRGMALRVEVPGGDNENTSHPSDGNNGGPESSRWTRYLQSPSQVFGQAVEKAKLTSKKNGPSPSERSRTSVDPYRRAAMDAQYRTDLSLQHESTPATTPAASGFGGWRGGKGKGTGSGGKEQEYREIHFHPLAGPVPAPIPETNRVVTSKYNVITFIPIFLFEMFSRVAYLYFLIQASLSWWSVVSPYSGIGATAALVFVLLVAAVKAIWEDSKRHQEDQRMNKSIAHRSKEDGSVEDIQWTDVQVGDALVVRDDENFPADLLCLWSSLDDNVCFIRTTNLDGETNLKIRKPLDFKGITIDSKEDILKLDLTLKAEPPNKNLHKFKGSAIVRSSELNLAPHVQSASDENGKPLVEVAVTMNEMLLRGCTLKNSKEIVGLVVYTGKHSRIQMNATKTPLKVGSFDRFLNFQITLVILMQLAMCLFLAVANYIWIKHTGINHPYLALTYTVEGIYSNGFVQVIINFLTFWILLSYLVPISLFVTLEIVKFWQGFVFINVDKGMRDPVTGEYARCRNSNLNEDLGKVEYVFSDKTGTLTSNEMQLRLLSVKGQVFGNARFRLEEHPSLKGLSALRRFDGRLAQAARAAQNSPAWDALVSGGGSNQRVMAYHHSNPSHGTADMLGLAHQGVSLEDFDPNAVSIEEEGEGEEEGKSHSMVHPQEKSGGGGGVDDTGAATARAAVALGHHMMDFFTNICLCHSLILEPQPEGEAPLYQGPSPDEVALVEAARQMGFEFKARAQASVTLDMLGMEVTYEVLNVMEYSSERGCMSVIARSPDGTIRLYCKGADSKVMKKIRPDTDADLLSRTNHDLHTFAKSGLRTLVIASKVIPKDFYDNWDARYQEASRMFEGRDASMDALGHEIEDNLELIGVTAIEDKLQDGVPEAIRTLLDADIRVWMITGDKQETAVNIAVSCDLVRNVDDVMMLNIDEKSDHAAEQAASLLDGCIASLCSRYNSFSSSASTIATHNNNNNPAAAVTDIKSIPDTWREGELAVDGPTLTFILGDKLLRRKLAQLAARCSGVVVSRSSPSQKAAIVRNMAEYEMEKAAGQSKRLIRWYRRYRQRLQGKMLAIGDGANDVAMIQTADVGVGIMGKEGRQAVNNSDYAFSQFRFLVPLLLIHGNLSYYRLARLIKYSFYKNITFAFVMFYYQFYNGFSGQALVDSITAAVFNVVFTSIPILLLSVLDRPVGELQAFVRYPPLYDKRRSRALTTASFWKSGVLQGIIHGAISFFIPYYAITTSGSHNITDVYSLGKVTFVALLGTVTLEVALVARYWTWVFFWFVVLSYVLVYPYMVIFPLLELAVGYYDPANVGVAYQVLASPSFWFIIILCYMITFGARFAERTWLWTFRPHDTMILTEKEAVARAKGETFFSEVSGASKKRLMALGSIQSSSVKPKSKKDKRRGGDQRPAVVVAEDVAYVGQGKGKGLANVNGGDQIMKDSSGIETGTPRRRVADSAALRRLHTSSDTSLTEVGEASEHSGDTFEFTRPGSLDDGRDSDSMKKWDSLKPLPK